MNLKIFLPYHNDNFYLYINSLNKEKVDKRYYLFVTVEYQKKWKALICPCGWVRRDTTIFLYDNWGMGNRSIVIQQHHNLLSLFWGVKRKTRIENRYVVSFSRWEENDVFCVTYSKNFSNGIFFSYIQQHIVLFFFYLKLTLYFLIQFLWNFFYLFLWLSSSWCILL